MIVVKASRESYDDGLIEDILSIRRKNSTGRNAESFYSFRIYNNYTNK